MLHEDTGHIYIVQWRQSITSIYMPDNKMQSLKYSRNKKIRKLLNRHFCYVLWRQVTTSSTHQTRSLNILKFFKTRGRLNMRMSFLVILGYRQRRSRNQYKIINEVDWEKRESCWRSFTLNCGGPLVVIYNVMAFISQSIETCVARNVITPNTPNSIAPGTYNTQELPCRWGPGPHIFTVYSQ